MVILYIGFMFNYEMLFEFFERMWGRGNYWYLVLVFFNVILFEMILFIYVSVVYDMFKVGDKVCLLVFLEIVLYIWLMYWLSYFLIVNYYLE